MTGTGDPQDQFDAVEDPELTQSPLAEADDVYVRGLLAIAGDATDPLPDEIAARWDAALAAQAVLAPSDEFATAGAGESPAAGSHAEMDQALNPVTAIVPPQAKRRSPRGLRFAGIAASVAALALASGVVANQVASPDGSGTPDGSTVAGASAAPEALPIADTVTTSGFSYSRADLDEEVRTLVREGDEYLQAPMEPAAGPDASDSNPLPETGSGPQREQPASGPSIAVTDDPSVKAFLTDKKKRDNCTANLAQTVNVRPVAVDIGYFEGQPVAIVVLPATTDRTRVDVWVVDPDCDLEDAEVRLFRRMPLP